MTANLNSFAWLLDRLAYEPRRNGKLALMTDYFRRTTDPERGHALAAMTGQLAFANASLAGNTAGIDAMLREAAAETDQILRREGLYGA